MGKPSVRGQHRGNHNGTKSERREDSRTSYRDKMSQRALNASDAGYSGSQIVIPFKKIEYLTERQRQLGASIRVNTATLATGPAGTGKTHVGIAEEIPAFLKDRKRCFVLTNPATEIGEKLGTLPGDKDDKVAISTRPLRDILVKILGATHVDNLVRAGRIMFEPLGSILGTTFDDATIIFDEAQNSTPEQMKALLTRVGHRSKVVVAGDYKEQKFIPGMSGLEDAIGRIGHLPSVGHIEFTPDDIIRSGFCKDVILAYRQG